MFSRLSLLWKILIPTSLVMTLVFAITGWLVQRSVVNTTYASVEQEAKALLGSLRTRLHRVSTDNEPGENPALMKSIRNGPVRAAVNFAHPTHANHSDTDSTCHSDTFHVVKSQGYSLQRC